MRGYKVFNKDWTCRGFQYEVGGTYEIPVEQLEICESGFHFCTKLEDCFNYYSPNPFMTRIAEIKALGEVVGERIGDSKCCTNKIHITKEVPLKEAINLIAKQSHDWQANKNFGKNNCGKGNYGLDQSGYENLGSRNDGRRNWGKENCGMGNIGKCNIGSLNIGSENFGLINIGMANIGTYNVGDCNIGLLNKGNNTMGIFCTIPTYITLFNKPTTMTLQDFLRSDGYAYVNDLIRYISSGVTTTKEANNKNSIIKFSVENLVEEETTVFKNKLATRAQYYWNNYLTDFEKEAIFDLPNFDPKIFKEITFIDTTDEYKEYLKKKN